MEINVRLEEEKDYQSVEELTRAAFGYSDRIMRGQIGCPYEHWMVHELRNQDGIMAQFCFWKTGVLSPVWVQGSGSLWNSRCRGRQLSRVYGYGTEGRIFEGGLRGKIF